MFTSVLSDTFTDTSGSSKVAELEAQQRHDVEQRAEQDRIVMDLRTEARIMALWPGTSYTSWTSLCTEARIIALCPRFTICLLGSVHRPVLLVVASHTQVQPSWVSEEQPPPSPPLPPLPPQYSRIMIRVPTPQTPSHRATTMNECGPGVRDPKFTTRQRPSSNYSEHKNNTNNNESNCKKNRKIKNKLVVIIISILLDKFLTVRSRTIFLAVNILINATLRASAIFRTLNVGVLEFNTPGTTIKPSLPL